MIKFPKRLSIFRIITGESTLGFAIPWSAFVLASRRIEWVFRLLCAGAVRVSANERVRVRMRRRDSAWENKGGGERQTHAYSRSHTRMHTPTHAYTKQSWIQGQPVLQLTRFDIYIACVCLCVEGGYM